MQQSRNNSSSQAYLTLPSALTGVKIKNKQSDYTLLHPTAAIRGVNLQAYKEPVDEVSEEPNPNDLTQELFNNSEI